MEGIWGEVRRIQWTDPQVQLAKVFIPEREEEVEAFYYRYGQREIRVGEKVLVNLAALDLQLGTGGYGFIMAAHSQGGYGSKRGLSYGGRMIKWRYTPHQTPLMTVECEESPHHPLFCQPFSLEQRMVLVGELHSMLLVLAALLFQWQPQRKLVYIMDDQAALHLGVSLGLRRLKKLGQIVTITCGQAMGGDVEAVNLYTALEAAVKVAKGDDIIITQGPGVVGTRTTRGFSGMQLVHWIHAVSTLEGIPVVIPRLSFADGRSRHRGLSEHTRYPLAEHTLARVHLPYPVGEAKGEKERQREELLASQLETLKEKHDLIPVETRLFREELDRAISRFGEIKTMGRTYRDDPLFFEGVGAAFYYYREHIRRLGIAIDKAKEHNQRRI